MPSNAKLIRLHANKGQVLILVFFLFLLAATFSSALYLMLQSDMQARTWERDGLSAFYIAQAGAEWAKSDLKSDWNNLTGHTITGNFNSGTYTVTVSDNPPNGRIIICSGRAGSSLRQIRTAVSRSGGPAPNPYIYTQDSWKEE